MNGELNVSDLLTRRVSPKGLNLDSEWQNGPKFLELPIDKWPIRQDNSNDILPEQAEIKTHVLHSCIKVEDIILSERFSNFVKFIRVSARVLSVCLKKPYSLKYIIEPVTVAKYNNAVKYWVKHCQRNLLTELEKGARGEGKFRKLSPEIREDGVYVIGGRASRWFEASYNKCRTPILPGSHNFAKLYVKMIHNDNHDGVDSVIAKVRLTYWIIGLLQLCKSVVYKCVVCRRLRGKLGSQKMGKLPLERLKPAPPWNSIGIDLFGPFEIRGEVNKRSSRKSYGVIFFCLPSTAVLGRCEKGGVVCISLEVRSDAFFWSIITSNLRIRTLELKWVR